jgi:adenylylsulfate kinase-like enzyme
VWLTGPPASGKTTVARALSRLLAGEGLTVVHLESDVLRPILAPGAGYLPEERDRVYRSLADLAALLVSQNVPVILDATAPRRAHRERARAAIARFLEVLVDAPASVREARDPKGLYRRAREGQAPNLPGATESYEPPGAPDGTLSGVAPPEANANELRRLLRERGFA